MARPVRIELPGAIYHVTSRGCRRADIFVDDLDRVEWLAIVGRVCQRLNWKIHVYCMMNNHFHIVLETIEANLSKGMRQLNGVYTQYFNRSHHHVGPIFQGRFKGILVEKEAYLLELSRFVVLNPLRAQMVDEIEDWEWSSYLAYCGKAEQPQWLDSSWVFDRLANAGSTPAKQYPKFVQEGINQPPVWLDIKQQIFLGSTQFVETMLNELERIKQGGDKDPERCNRQKLARLAKLENKSASRNDAIRRAYATGKYTLEFLGEHFGLHYTSVSRIVNRAL